MLLEIHVRAVPQPLLEGNDNDADCDGYLLLQYLPATTRTLLIVFVILLLIFTAIAMIVHELGHFVAARSCKVSVSELGLGIGPRLFGFRVRNLRLSLRALPIGSVVWLDGNTLRQKSIRAQLFVHLGGIVFNLIAGLLTYGTTFGWLNLLLAAGNILPIYQHDGWKCGVVLMRALLQRKSQPAEWAFTFSGGFISLVVAWVVIRVFI